MESTGSRHSQAVQYKSHESLSLLQQSPRSHSQPSMLFRSSKKSSPTQSAFSPTEKSPLFCENLNLKGLSLILPQSYILGWPCIVPLGAAETSPEENRNKMIVFTATVFQTGEN